MIIGYARIPRAGQPLADQVDQLKAAGCDRVFTEIAGGARSARPVLAEALSQLTQGDVLVVCRLDRLGRTVRQLVELAERLESEGVDFRSLDDGFNTNTARGRTFFHTLSALGAMERKLAHERNEAGVEAGRARGRAGGRKRKLTPERIEEARRLMNGSDVGQVAAKLGVSRSTLYRSLGVVPGTKPARGRKRR